MSDDLSPAAGADGPEVPDEDLIAAVAERGDRGAFVALFRRYGGRIKGFLMRAGVGEAQAEEVAQEVMVTLWRRAEAFDRGRGSAATWIFTIVRNRRIDLARRAGRVESDPALAPVDPEPAASAEEGFAGAERDARVRDAIATLSAGQREVVRRAFFAGQSQSRIAEELGLPLGTVKSRLRLAFDRLRAELGDGFVEELRDD